MNNKINKKYNVFKVITPENIKNYVPDFPIEMNAESKYSLKFRLSFLAPKCVSVINAIFNLHPL